MKSDSTFAEHIQYQFDCICRKVMIRASIKCKKELARRREKETLFSDLSQAELEQLYTLDTYNTDIAYFTVKGFDIEVKDILLAEALDVLSERKREILLLSYYTDLTDEDIAKQMEIARSTITRNRKAGLYEMKKHMEEIDENNKQKK